MSRLPIRLRLTAAFALALALVLVAAGAFVHLRLAADLDEGIDAALDARAAAVIAANSAAAGAPGDAEEGFALRLAADGTVLERAGGLRGDAPPGGGEFELPGVEGTVRVLARDGVVVGQSLEDRDEALGNLVTSFAIGGPIAVVLASLIGYALATAGLAPVEAMRRRAQQVSLDPGGPRLPVPAARDEIRRLADTLNAMLERLRRAHEHERRFVADAGHELRTPLAVIKAELEGALRAGGHAPQVHEALVAALEECDHLAQLAEDLLVVARTGEGELPLRLAPLDLPELLEQVRRRFAGRAGERGRAIAVAVEGGPVAVADELRLLQALGNLVDNALRHGAGEIVLRAKSDATGTTLEVSDAGAGFAPGFADRAFERFARGEDARGGTGTGLGLAIVRAIAEAHGGRAELPAGRGATVRLWLPSASSQAPAVASFPVIEQREAS